jgi:hypothetical protein
MRYLPKSTSERRGHFAGQGLETLPINAPMPRKIPKHLLIPKYLLNLAGEYRVCSELNKRRAFATVTYGNRKSADVYAIGSNGTALKIEVKASQTDRFLTGLGQKRLGGRSRPPDFWILAQFLPKKEERFFVLSHGEICAIQKKVNREWNKGYEARNGRKFDPSKGVDGVYVKHVVAHEGRWKKIIDGIGGPERDDPRRT